MRMQNDLGGLTLTHFDCFIRVAELGTTMRAAEALNLSQPLVSQKIAQLERAVGVELFARQKRRLVLTEAGGRFLAHSRGMLGELERVVEELRPGGGKDVLRIGFSDGQESSEIRAVLRACAERFPETEIQPVIESRILLSEKLLAGEVDICVVIDTEGLCEHPDVRARTILSLPMACIVHKNSDLAQKARLTFQDLEGHRCYWPAVLRKTKNLRDIQACFSKQGVDVVWEYKDVDYYTLRRYLYEEESFLLTYSAVVEDSSMKLCPLGGISYPVVVAWRREKSARLADYTAWLCGELPKMKLHR